MAEEQPPEPSESEQELVEQLQAELSRLKVSDLLLQTVYTISSLGYHRLSGENKDLEQARAGDRGPEGPAAGARRGGSGRGRP